MECLDKRSTKELIQIFNIQNVFWSVEDSYGYELKYKDLNEKQTEGLERYKKTMLTHNAYLESKFSVQESSNKASNT